jgi:putative DNA methylase
MSEPYRKKLIEVALPLDAINEASAHEKRSTFIKGHPRSIHHWWARRPLAACRAVLFASLIDDPSSRTDLFPSEAEQDAERQRLFRIIEEIVRWENTNNPRVLKAAREEILAATGGTPPAIIDPFCGGGSIPIEAQRLGLPTYASDLNPVAVLITKALVEIPPRFAGMPPVNPDTQSSLARAIAWDGASGLAEDVRYYGNLLRDQALARLGTLYPTATAPDGTVTNVFAWLWARTVTCPNPSCRAEMPLVRSFVLSSKRGREHFLEPMIDAVGRTVEFIVRPGKTATEGTVSRGGARCIFCGTAVPFDHIRAEGRAGRLGAQLLAMVAESERGRVYLAAEPEHAEFARLSEPDDLPETELPEQALGFRVQAYGIRHHRSLFTSRQLRALATSCELVEDVRTRVRADGGTPEYADAIAIYLALAIGKIAPYSCAFTSWHSSGEQLQSVFARQSLSMVWDYAEVNPFSRAVGFASAVRSMSEVIRAVPATGVSEVTQLDAASSLPISQGLVFTDPPYYDNIGYADLSDFFYVWLKRALTSVDPQLFATLLSPKQQEIIADPFRFPGGKHEAKAFFEEHLKEAFRLMERVHEDSDYPLVLYYAFKQAETPGDANGSPSTGWETMLAGLIESGLSITGTWPIRSEGESRARSRGGFNALASSIVIVCRPRPITASIGTRRDLVLALKSELPDAMRALQHGGIAPVDLAQAAIGPGMAIFSRYAKVVETDGSTLDVRTALSLINDALGEALAEQDGVFDPDTRFAIAWFEQRGAAEGPFGEADVLARAKNTAVRGLDEAGVLRSHAGKVRLLRRDELGDDWDPARDRRLTVWEVTQHLIRRLEVGGESDAAELLRRLGGLGEAARELAYRLYTICERKGWAQEALGYNGLVVAWPEIARLAMGEQTGKAQQVLEVDVDG